LSESALGGAFFDGKASTDAPRREPRLGARSLPARAPTVLQVVPALEQGGGGTERATIDIARALVEAGWNAVVASSGGPLVRELDRAGARHVVLPVQAKAPWSLRANASRLAKLIVQEQVDLVHARSRAPAWSARAAARRTKRPFITTFHGIYGHGTPWQRWYNSVMVKADRVIANSQYTSNHMQAYYKVDREAIRLVPRGVDLSLFDPQQVPDGRLLQLVEAWRLPDDAPVVMLPGRLTRWKGHETLIAAIAALGRRDLRCVLVGGDQGRTGYRRDLERRIAKAGLDGIVQLVGPCLDMPAAYKLANVVVSASTKAEAFGRVAVEAQAMGRPVIATDIGASRETVIPGQTGWLVPPGDPQALAEALDTALTLRPSDREAMSLRAMLNVRAHYPRELMCRRTMDIYRELLDR
jgi:glycosyltransferase involved in cell wall biosynthesis